MIKSLRLWWHWNVQIVKVYYRLHKFLFDCHFGVIDHNYVSEYTSALVQWSNDLEYYEPEDEPDLFDARATIKALVKDVGRVEKVWNYEGTWHAEVVLYWNKM